MKNKIYIIKTNQDYQKLAISALKKVKSQTILPRILLNFKSEIITNIFCGLVDFVEINQPNIKKFKLKVHSKYFDIGLFLFNRAGTNMLKVIDGGGHMAGEFVTNIFDKVFSLNDTDFLAEQKKTIGEYKKIDKSKLIIQQVKM